MTKFKLWPQKGALDGAACLDARCDQRELILSNEDLIQVLASSSQADRIFDSLLPEAYRKISSRQWTVAEVAKRVAQWLERDHSDKKIIDIGSGVGKFCILLGLQSRLQIYGIEQRKGLYLISEQLRGANLLTRIKFLHGNMIDLSWKDYDIYYLYNPFQEHVVNNGWSRIDGEIGFHACLFGKYTDEIYRQLIWAEKGKILITFHGYGGIVPSAWKVVQQTTINGGELCMWEKMV